jgi:hypothetical protein
MKYVVSLLVLCGLALPAEANAVSRSVVRSRAVVQRERVVVRQQVRVQKVVQVQKVVAVKQVVQVQKVVAVQQAYYPVYAAQIILPVQAYYAAPIQLAYSAPCPSAIRSERVIERFDIETGRVRERIIER